jgi:hypothetical protein
MAPNTRLDEGVVDATERWFVNRGLPHFIADYNASQDIWTRAVPALTALFLLELLLASKVGWVGAFSGLYFMVVLLTDATYREEFLEQVVSDVRDAFAVRAVYLAYLGQAA